MKVAVIMGSLSDKECMDKTVEILKKFGIEVEYKVLSAHRSPALLEEYLNNIKDRGIEVIIAAAGKAAHLAGNIAARTILPVIGVPMKTSDLGGIDSLLSTVQMPGGVPVATVSIGTSGAINAAYLAVEILALKYAFLKDKLYQFRKEQEEKIIKSNEELEKH